MTMEESTRSTTYIEPTHGDTDVEEDKAEKAHDNGEEGDHCMGHLQDLSFGGLGIEVSLRGNR